MQSRAARRAELPSPWSPPGLGTAGTTSTRWAPRGLTWGRDGTPDPAARTPRSRAGWDGRSRALGWGDVGQPGLCRARGGTRRAQGTSGSGSILGKLVRSGDKLPSVYLI